MVRQGHKIIFIKAIAGFLVANIALTEQWHRVVFKVFGGNFLVFITEKRLFGDAQTLVFALAAVLGQISFNRLTVSLG